MQSNIAEFVGCLFLTLALGLTGDPLASGLVIIGIITVGRLFSHAHFNPAVTLAFWSAGRLSSRRLCSYVVSQTAGALGGCLLILAISGVSFRIIPTAAASPLQYSGIELIFGFLLALLYLTTFDTSRSASVQIGSITIGITYTGILLISSTASGGIANPAVSLGAAVTDLLNHGDSWLYLAAYMAAPATGGLAAGLIFTRRPMTDPAWPEEE